ncbi:MAG: InlB B-repeat-containing protein [Spirochaetales bacterium]|nr:InlB B-repeat-containing protein [Spirochaetales bacterium]
MKFKNRLGKFFIVGILILSGGACTLLNMNVSETQVTINTGSDRAIPTDVATLVLTVSADDMDSITKIVTAGSSLNLTVPSGNDRRFYLIAKDSSSTTLYRGEAFADLVAGESISVAIQMENVTPLFTVTFESNGGTAVSSQLISQGELVSQPSYPTLSSYSFLGWYSDPAFTTLWSFSTNTVSENMTLYAKWDGVELDQTGIQLGIDGTQTLTATMITVQTLTWSSDNESVATVDAAGLVTGVSDGIAIITAATDTDYRATCAVIVNLQHENYDYSGVMQTWTVPNGVSQIYLYLRGAEGGGSRLSSNTASGLGGLGGSSYGTLAVTEGDIINIFVGGQGGSSETGLAAGGWNGGGSGYGSSAGEPGNGGGGASDIRLNGTALTDRIIVAGGGGGGGEDSGDSVGQGGGLEGTGYTGYDATQLAAGTGGAFGVGGSTDMADGGGGGGGWYGGGTETSTTIGADSQGGGGGSGYIDGVSNGTTTAGMNQGNGRIVIGY